nr:EOG090X0JRY [Scapholeberis mucronata]
MQSDVNVSRFSLRNWSYLTSVGIAAAGVSLFLYARPSFLAKLLGAKSSCVNPNIKKDQGKVVDTLDIEDIGDKKVFCRCWRSALFPLCDGSHNKHNAETGDNVGPLIIGNKNK